MNGPNNPIGWCDFTANPVDGLCKHGCPYCYEARRRKRFKLPSNITFRGNWFNVSQAEAFARKHHRGARIFVGSTHDLFGSWIPDEWIAKVIQIIKRNPQHTFIFLTKNPNRYASFKFPDNCWLGVSIVTLDHGTGVYLPIKSNICFISFEPLISYKVAYYGKYEMFNFDWLIIGGLSPNPCHKKSWVDDLLKQAEYQKIPIFLKDNLHYPIVRREFPK